MCRFITVLGSATCRPPATAILQNLRGWAAETNNQSLAKLAPNTVQFISARAGCDCGTVLGRDEAAAQSEVETVNVAEKWRRKGWSEAKIERSLADKAQGKATTTHRGPTDSFDLWEEILRQLLADAGANEIGLILHEYSGGLDSEMISATRRRVPANVSIGDALRSLEEDELVVFDRAKLRAQAA